MSQSKGLLCTTCVSLTVGRKFYAVEAMQEIYLTYIEWRAGGNRGTQGNRKPNLLSRFDRCMNISL